MAEGKPVTRALAMNEDIIAKAVEKLLTSKPFVNRIVDTICNAISKQFEDRIKALEAKVDLLSEKLDGARKEALLANEKLEQYSRRNTLRIFGLPVRHKDEDTDKVIVELFNEKLGVPVTAADIDCCHRLHSKDNARSPILVKFCRRSVKNRVYYSKKKLKGTKIVIFEDLTKMRTELLKRARETYGMNNVWTSEGVVTIKVGNKVRKIHNEEDLQVP